MKKVICILSLLLLVGCSNPTNIIPITKSLSFDAEMNYYNEYYELSVTISKDGNTQIKITQPIDLKDLCFSFENDEVFAEYKGMKYNYENAHNTAALKFIYDVFHDKNQSVSEKDNNFIVSGKTDLGEYIMYIAPTGLPLKIVDNYKRFEITIKNPTIITEKEP